MTTKFKSLALAVTLSVAFPCVADQAAYIQKSDALAAKTLLSKVTTIKDFCAPCGDKEASTVSVKTIDIARTDSEDYWEVQVNGGGIDLAYSYFFTNNKWKNIAMEIGLSVSDVPEFID
jgi:hypothetical protein